MIVRFKKMWVWGGGTHTGKKGEVSSMRRFRVHPRGVEVPDALFEFLPKDAEILKYPDETSTQTVDDLVVDPSELEENPLNAQDLFRTAEDEVQRILEEAHPEEEVPPPAPKPRGRPRKKAK